VHTSFRDATAAAPTPAARAAIRRESCRYNRAMSITFRTATPADADAAVPLIYRSGPATFDFVFTVPGKLEQGRARQLPNAAQP